MANKKCPKCGEENPSEAVMCWACYTPLMGGAAAATAGGMVAPSGGVAAVRPAAAAQQGGEKKAVDPKIFLVAGLLVLAIVIGGFTTGIFTGGGGGEEITPTTEPPSQVRPPKNLGGNNNATANPPVIVPDPPSRAPTTTDGGGDGGGPPFRVMVAPNPRYTTGVMGIVARQPNVSPAQAVTLGRAAKNAVARNGRWNRMQVVVFNNQDVAKSFLKYQAARQYLSLSGPQFQDLAQQRVWESVPAYLEFEGNRVTPYQPTRNPSAWWTSN